MSASGDSYAGQRARKRYQAARNGQAVPPPTVVDVHGMDAAEDRN